MTDLPFNLFDILLGAILIAGLIHGRKHGLSRELVGLIKWITLLFGSALFYRPVGQLLAGTGLFGLLAAYVFAYLAAVLFILLLFSFLERKWNPKLEGSDVFGRSEYFLGMGSGMLRFACVLLVSLSLLNARDFSPAELKAMEQYEEENYGSHVFPGLHNIQTAVFERSFMGALIKEDLSFLLITPTCAERQPAR